MPPEYGPRRHIFVQQMRSGRPILRWLALEKEMLDLSWTRGCNNGPRRLTASVTVPRRWARESQLEPMTGRLVVGSRSPRNAQDNAMQQWLASAQIRPGVPESSASATISHLRHGQTGPQRSSACGLWHGVLRTLGNRKYRNIQVAYWLCM